MVIGIQYLVVSYVPRPEGSKRSLGYWLSQPVINLADRNVVGLLPFTLLVFVSSEKGHIINIKWLVGDLRAILATPPPVIFVDENLFPLSLKSGGVEVFE